MKSGPSLLLLCAAAAPLLLLSACGGGPRTLEDPFPTAPMTVVLKSAAFADQGVIPKRYTCDGENLSPPLTWSGVPKEARSLVLLCEDPDAPLGTYTHWVLLDLTPDDTDLSEGLPNQTLLAIHEWAKRQPPPRQGTNDFGKPGYGGPCPPSGKHRYVFRLFALDGPLTVGPTPRRNAVMRALEGHVLAQGRLVGVYKR